MLRQSPDARQETESGRPHRSLVGLPTLEGHLRPVHRALQYDQLVAKGEDLQVRSVTHRQQPHEAESGPTEACAGPAVARRPDLPVGEPRTASATCAPSPRSRPSRPPPGNLTHHPHTTARSEGALPNEIPLNHPPNATTRRAPPQPALCRPV